MAPRTPKRITVPSREDPLLRRFTEVLGGPLGRHTEPGRTEPGFFTLERVLVALTIIGALAAVAAKNACRVGGWGGVNPYVWACYSDLPPLFHARGFAENPFAPFVAGANFEYPVLMSFVASITALPIVPGDYNRSLAYFDLNVLLIAALWIAVVLMTSRSAGRRPWDAAMVAIAPGMILASTINWDIWAVAALAGAVLAFSRNRTVLAGVLIGVGTATKLFPILFLGAVVVLALRTGRWRAFGTTTAAAAAAWIAVNLPAMLVSFEGWKVFWTFTREREAGWSSLWHAWNTIADAVGAGGLSAETINTAGFLAFLLCCAGIAVLGVIAPQRPRLIQLVFLIVASFVLFNKVYSPQFVIWLIPLVALAWPRWRDFLVWQLVEVLHFFAIWAFLYQMTADLDAQHALAPAAYVLAVFAHMGMVLYLMGRVVHSMWDPHADPVRRVGQDDPTGGAFAGAGDAAWIERLRSTLTRAATSRRGDGSHES
ncbi:glycosyltransferase family 87 protein [Zhihengliuella halotolerans]|uniref:Putative membrane protein n=1 Tax=Zhihengliuella halotolerans TaxID=370736 RepID=A0A4Q8AFV7_9MICC|nr:glycosyltransferase 87 family protein [Zhihengliuella halotolerans]RZU63134.1 putative membrane protein [Zhihengliuella halotolerans]